MIKFLNSWTTVRILEARRTAFTLRSPDSKARVSLSTQVDCQTKLQSISTGATKPVAASWRYPPCRAACGRQDRAPLDRAAGGLHRILSFIKASPVPVCTRELRGAALEVYAQLVAPAVWLSRSLHASSTCGRKNCIASFSLPRLLTCTVRRWSKSQLSTRRRLGSPAA